MNIQTFTFNPVQVNTYLIWDESKECVIIDAGCFNEDEFTRINDFIKKNELIPVHLINTHCHFDHIFGVNMFREAYNLQWSASLNDSMLVERSIEQSAMFGIPMGQVEPIDIDLKQGSEIKFGQTTLQVIETPGHSLGGLCFYEESSKSIFSGDTLFSGSIGRTDLPGGNQMQLVSQIRNKLMTLPQETKVYTGHGSPTTISYEKENNPYL